MNNENSAERKYTLQREVNHPYMLRSKNNISAYLTLEKEVIGGA